MKNENGKQTAKIRLTAFERDVFMLVDTFKDSGLEEPVHLVAMVIAPRALCSNTCIRQTAMEWVQSNAGKDPQADRLVTLFHSGISPRDSSVTYSSHAS